MIIAHACARCGECLTHVRASWSSSLGLPVVVCPTCRASCVRRRPPGLVVVRRVRAALSTLLALGWRVAVPLLLGIATFGLAAILVEMHRHGGAWAMAASVFAAGADPSSPEFRMREEGAPLALGFALMIGVSTGVMLSGYLPHVERRVVWWGAYIAWLGGGPLIMGVLAFAGEASRQGWSQGLTSAAEDFGQLAIGSLIVGLGTAPLGMPLGAGLRRATRHAAERRWVRLSKRVRARRARLRT